jgi:GAF domain
VKTCDPALVRLKEELADVGTMAEGLHQRAGEVLEALGRLLSFDSGWLAVRDPERRRQVPLATTGAAEPLRRYFESPGADAELEHLGLNSAQRPVLASELPVPLPEISAWGEYLLPAGFRGGVAGALFSSTGRHVGFLSLLAEDPGRPDPDDRQVLAAVSRVIADALDRTQEIATIARIVGTAEAGVVLTRGGDSLPLPGLPDDRLLAPDSPILAVATRELSAGGPHTAFLAPAASPGGERLVRVTALDCALPDLDHLSAAVLLSSPGKLRGLTSLDLRLLGHLVAGTTQVPAVAAALHVDPGTTTEALRRAQVALDAPSPTAAATRALRTGLRIPPALSGPARNGLR